MDPKHRAARLSFARKAFRRHIVAWRNVRTDSSILRMHGKASWQLTSLPTAATRGTAGRPKHSPGVHVCMGMTYRGVTTLKFVTGTHKLLGITSIPRPNSPRLEYGPESIMMCCSSCSAPRGQKVVSACWALVEQLAAAARRCPSSQNHREHGDHGS